MPTYIPDTNVLIGFGKDAAIRQKLERSLASGTSFAIAPPVIIELVRGMVANNGKTFANDKEVFPWIRGNRFPVMELTLPFAGKLLKSKPIRTSGVQPLHYGQLIGMVVESGSFSDFMARAEAPDSVWKMLGNLHSIHEGQLDKELGALVTLASNGGDTAAAFSRMFGMPGCRPNPLIVRKLFSAAFEFLESSLAKVRYGAKPRKNDPGLYVDFQLFFYLGDSALSFLTQEDFSAEVHKSPQKTRIVRVDSI
jgi:hypothetical protein